MASVDPLQRPRSIRGKADYAITHGSPATVPSDEEASNARAFLRTKGCNSLVEGKSPSEFERATSLFEAALQAAAALSSIM
jgi:hypothetical protein